MNIGVLVSGPIQFVLDETVALLEVKSQLRAFAAASALRARQSGTIVRQQSRRLFGQTRSCQLPSADQNRTMEGTAELSSQRPSPLTVQELRPASSASLDSTLHPVASLQASTNVTSKQFDVVEQPAAQPRDQSTLPCDEHPCPRQGVLAQLPIEMAGEEVIFVETGFL